VAEAVFQISTIETGGSSSRASKLKTARREVAGFSSICRRQL